MKFTLKNIGTTLCATPPYLWLRQFLRTLGLEKTNTSHIIGTGWNRGKIGQFITMPIGGLVETKQTSY